MIRLTGLALVAVSALGSCTHAGEMPVDGSPGQVTQNTPSVILADALARADLAASTNDATALARALATMGALGARPLDPAAQAQLAQWQSRSPVTAPPLRGRTLGPGFRKGTLTAGAELRIEQTFLSGQKASVALSTPDRARLRLEVIDNTAATICRNIASAPACAWIPIHTQRHVIQLTNLDRRNTRFYLVIE